MSERHEPACPMMRAATGLQHNLGRLELAEEGFDLAPSELAAQHRAVLLVDTVQREHVLGRVDRNALKLHEDAPSLEHDSPTLARDAVGPSTPTAATRGFAPVTISYFHFTRWSRDIAALPQCRSPDSCPISV